MSKVLFLGIFLFLNGFFVPASVANDSTPEDVELQEYWDATWEPMGLELLAQPKVPVPMPARQPTAKPPQTPQRSQKPAASAKPVTPAKPIAPTRSTQKPAPQKPNPSPQKAPQCQQLNLQAHSRCRPMTFDDRKRILALSNPIRYPNTRYQLPPRMSVPFEVETDCARFVQNIYTQAGFPLPRLSSWDYQCLKNFRVVADNDAHAGDLVVYPGHVGIMDLNGDIISATYGGRGRPATLPVTHPQFVSSIQIVPRTRVARGPSKVLRWVCPN